MDMREYYFVLQRKLVEAKYTEMDIKHFDGNKEFPVYFPEGLSG